MVDWIETRIAKLKLLHKEGLSGAAIAKKLGPAFTKGMVIGKLRRLELASKAAKSKTGWNGAFDRPAVNGPDPAFSCAALIATSNIERRDWSVARGGSRPAAGVRER